MKRSNLARKTPLARGEATLRRTTPLKTTVALAPGARKQRARMPAGVVAEVVRHSRKRCVRCGSRRALQRHHVLPVQTFPQYETVALNMVLACPGCHDEHERAHRRLRLAELPEAVVTWARSRGGRETLYIERNYPREVA